VHLLLCELYRFQNAWNKDKKKIIILYLIKTTNLDEKEAFHIFSLCRISNSQLDHVKNFLPPVQITLLKESNISHGRHVFKFQPFLIRSKITKQK